MSAGKTKQNVGDIAQLDINTMLKTQAMLRKMLFTYLLYSTIYQSKH